MSEKVKLLIRPLKHGIAQYMKRTFCRHVWETDGMTWRESDSGVCHDSSYNFRCTKCGKLLVVFAQGIDCFKTPEAIYNTYMKSHPEEADDGKQ